MKPLEEGNPTPEDFHFMTREGMERVIQILWMIMKFEQIVHRKAPLPILSRARSRHAVMPDIAPSSPNNAQAGRRPEAGFAGDAPKQTQGDK